MQNMSFMLTTPQIEDETKDVTRRLGWDRLKPGDRVQACKKCMGLKKGEKIQRLKVIEIISNTKEQLHRMIHNREYGAREAKREGFPELTGEAFVKMFCQKMKCKPSQIVNRIEFKYVKGDTNATIEATRRKKSGRKVTGKVSSAQRASESPSGTV